MNAGMNKIVLIFTCLLLQFCLNAQVPDSLAATQPQTTDTNSRNITGKTDESLLMKRKFNTMLIAGGAMYAGSVAILYQLWYKDYPQSSFHFFNDNDEWFQMDKLSHTSASYYIGNIGYNTLKWYGIEEKKAIWYGGFSGSVYQSILEVLDGFSAGWGASWGDIAANTAGSVIFTSQQALWGEQYLRLKHSYHLSPYSSYRYDPAKYSAMERMFKDYNGTTCWFSFNLKPLFRSYDRFPDWLCLSIGQSGDGMIGATGNPSEINGKAIPADIVRKRQFFLSADIDLTKVPIKSKYYRAFAQAVSFIKFPFPAMEFNKADGFRFHPVYY